MKINCCKDVKLFDYTSSTNKRLNRQINTICQTKDQKYTFTHHVISTSGDRDPSHVASLWGQYYSRPSSSASSPDTPVTSESDRQDKNWWKLPIVDDSICIPQGCASTTENIISSHPLTTLLKSVLRSSNCRVVWSQGPDCTPSEAQSRRSRSRSVSSAIAGSKVIHSLGDHPLRCLAAAQQIERHLWARNGSAAAGMAFNYGSPPLCKSFRDLDLTLVQVAAAGYGLGLGPRRTFTLLMSRYSMDGYLCDPVRRNNTGQLAVRNNTGWVNPPRLQDPDHAVSLAEAFFTTVILLVTELPPPNPISSKDDTGLRRSMRRELLHALAAESRSHSEAFAAASLAVSPRSDTEMSRTIFKELLRDIAKENAQRAGGAPTYELRPSCSDEYDPSFYHLRRNEHQHAMDCVARLRKAKNLSTKFPGRRCLPLVVPPLEAHPRFAPCRLILHLSGMDAAIRRALLFALTGGEWLPPPEPSIAITASNSGDSDILRSGSSFGSQRRFERSSSYNKKEHEEFSPAVVAQSSVSFLEVLQVLTLQIHTLTSMAKLHKRQELDAECLTISQSLSVKSYLERLIFVPQSLDDCWALRCPVPLPSAGSGNNRGSILGLLIALYEHRNFEGDDKQDEESGGKFLASDGLKWLLRFVYALVENDTNVSDAARSARDGVMVKSDSSASSSSTSPALKSLIQGMLSNLPDLWPEVKPQKRESIDKSKEARKEAQRRAMELMKKQQASFAASIEGFDDVDMTDSTSHPKEGEDLCIICRCDDRDGDNNGPLGFLGHVQRSKQQVIRTIAENNTSDDSIWTMARVVGDRGCQLRQSEEMDSPPIACLPTGSVVTVLQSKVSPKYDLLSRRVYVRHNNNTEGWASIQSSQGYIILSPLSNLCFDNSKWGSTRPLIRQCGHAAHLGCVDAHCLSLHQRAAGEQPYDGRFAANIEDGEFLCPLCKQLSNVLVPKGGGSTDSLRFCRPATTTDTHLKEERKRRNSIGMADSVSFLRNLLEHDMPATTVEIPKLSSHNSKLEKERDATRRFGAHLLQAMQITHENKSPNRSSFQQQLSPLISRKWDYEDDSIGNLLRLLRQQHIAWSAVGNATASAEASARDGTNIDDPWAGYVDEMALEKRESHVCCLELRRTIVATVGLLNVLNYDMGQLSSQSCGSGMFSNVIGRLLSNIVEGVTIDSDEQCSALMSLVNAMPCHVARDGTLSSRHEARSTAAAMWAIKGGVGVPLPLAVKLAPAKLKGSVWGTLDPSTASPSDLYRPAVAVGFLYTPLLGWDLNTFSGALYSSLLLKGSELKLEDLVLATKVLLLARLTQVLVTPYALPITNANEKTIPLSSSTQQEATALLQLQSHFHIILETSPKKDCSNMYQAAALALLPYSRSLILLLRGMASAMKAHNRHKTSTTTKPSPTDLLLQSILENEALFTTTDGFDLLRELNGPLPTQLIGEKFGLDGGWFHLMENWVKSFKHYENSRSNETSVTECEKHENVTMDTDAKMPASAHNTFHNSEMNNISAAVAATNIPNNNVSNSTTGLYNPSISDAESVDSSHDSYPNDDDASNYASDVEMAPPNITNQPPHEAAAEAALNFRQQLMRPHQQHHDHSDDDDDAMDDVIEAEDVIFDEALGDASVLLGLARRGGGTPTIGGDSTNSVLSGSIGMAQPEGSDEESSCVDSHAAAVSSADATEDGTDLALEREFGYVGMSAIIPYQSRFLGSGIGAGPRGTLFERNVASKVMADMSAFGMVHRLGATSSGLIRLPHSFVELYGLVNRVKGRDNANAMDETDDSTTAETAICLLTGAIMRSGSTRRNSISRSARPPGACTVHARKTGSGIGIFFLVQKCTVLLVHNNKSAYYASLYVDEHGEEDPGLRRGRPLFLKYVRYQALEALWRQHGIPREVAQIRSTSDRVIRDNWY